MREMQQDRKRQAPREDVVVSTFPLPDGREIRLSVTTWEGKYEDRTYVQFRIWRRGYGDKPLPTDAAVMFRPDQLDDVRAGLEAAAGLLGQAK